MPRKSYRAYFLGGVAALSLAATPSARAGASDPQEFMQIERGRYLAITSDCLSCHTVPGGQPFAGGRPIETPFGDIVAPNITPDLETGIGAWSDDAFDAAVRKGVRPDGARLYPAMPYNAYTKMSRDDVQAIRAYLNSVDPVANAVVANTLPFPFNIRAAMRIWNSLYFREGEFKPDPSKSAEWNRGAFLVDGPAHCGACHTPKTFLGGDRSDQYLQGSYLQGWSAPDITDDRRVGLGEWTAEDVATYLKSGHNRITAATGPMAEAVSLSTSHMTNEDRKAIATYLKSLPGKEHGDKPLPADTAMTGAGSAIYRDQCSACHGIEGRGVPGLLPTPRWRDRRTLPRRYG
jgi:mono/diheme cytochrome c family protein